MLFLTPTILLPNDGIGISFYNPDIAGGLWNKILQIENIISW